MDVEHLGEDTDVKKTLRDQRDPGLFFRATGR